MEIFFNVISFLAGIIVTFFAIGIFAYSKDREYNVRLYVAMDGDDGLYLYLGKPELSEDGKSWLGKAVCFGGNFGAFNLDMSDYSDMTVHDAPRDVTDKVLA